MKARVIVMTLAAIVLLHTATAEAEVRPAHATSAARGPRGRGKGAKPRPKTTPKPTPAPPATPPAAAAPEGATTVNAGAEVITTTSTNAPAAPAPASVLVVGKGRVSRLVQRVTADLGRLGLKVEQGEDHGTAAAVLTLDRTREGVLVRVESPGGKQPATEETMRSPSNGAPDDEIVAAHSVELVRAAIEANAKAAEEPAPAEAVAAPAPEPEPPPPAPPPPPPPAPPPSVIGFDVQGGITYPIGDFGIAPAINVGSSRVDLQACKLEYSIVSPK